MRWTMKLNPVAVLGLIAVLIFASGVVNADTYYVATNGNNSHSGDFTHPWLTWSKAFNTAVAGDTVYFRGGTYPMEVTTGMGIRYDTDNHNGTAGNPVQYFNYQDEVPVLDCSGVTSSIGYKWGIVIVDGSYLHFKGLRITGVLQHEESDICVGLQTEGADHVTFENMKIYDVDGVGVMTIDAVYIALINCDAYNCEDANATSPGRWGSGFGGSNCDVTTGYTYYYGCRAWECSDQGFTSGGQLSKVIYDHCWSFDNGSLEGDGLGWKLGYNAYDETSAEPAVVLKNSIAANNRFAGVSTNDQGHYGQDLDIYNNLFYHSEGYYDGETFIGGYGVFLLNPSTNDAGRVFKNNIEYDNERNYLINTYTHSNNSWDSSVTVTGADFASLELSQLGGARKSDGSLPDITFGHLVAGSDLIDAGTDVGLPYAGSAPDMGAFEIPFSLRIEAETFDDCNVFEYTDAVQIDPTEQYATSMMTGDWATFNDVVIPADGYYTFTVSNRGGGDPEYVSQETGVLGQFRIDMDGSFPATSGTIESTCIGPAFSGPLEDDVSAPVFLTAGTYVMTFNMLNSWGLYGVVDWIQIDPAPFRLRIEAETFDDCNVFEYTDAVQIDPTEQYATSMMTGDWATFNDVVIPAAGNYTFTVSNRGGGDPEYVSQEAGVLGQFRIDMDGDVTETSGTIESTCIGPAFSGPLDDNVSAPVFLTAGTYLMTFNMLNSWGLYGVVDWIQIDLAE